MANLVGQLGQTIKGSVANFGAGFKQAAISGNPALFGAGLAAIEKAFQKTAKEEKSEREKDREERRRDKQFNEENQNEQRKLDTDILKTLKAIERMLEDFISKNKKSFFDRLKEMFEPLLLLLSNIMGAFLRLAPLFPLIVAGLISLNDSLSDFVKLFAGWTKQLGAAFGNLIKKLGSLFDDIFKTNLFARLSAKLGNLFDGLFKDFKGLNILEKLSKGLSNFFGGLFKDFKGLNILEKLSKGLGSWVDDLFKAARGRIAGIAFVFLEKFGSFFDDAVKSIKSVFAGSFFSKLATIFDVELDFIKNFKLPEGFAKVKELFNTGMSSILSFFDDIANNPIFSKIATFLGKFAKSIPIIGNLIMIIEGFFAAFDTESIAAALGKQIDEVSLKDRISALLGGIIGSIFGIFDLIGTVINAIFGLEEKEGEESIQKKATRIATQFIDNVLKWLEGLGRFIIGLLTFDKKAMGAALGDMSQAVVDSLGVLLSMIANVFIDGINFLIRAIPFISNDNQIKKLSTFTARETQIASASKNVSARPKDAAGGKAWDEQYGGMYNKDGTLKKEFAKQQEDLLKRATAEGFYEALKRPGSLSVSEALNIQADTAREEFEWQQKQAQKAQQYQAERDALQDRFYGTLENGFEKIFTRMAGPGGFGSTAEGAPRSAIEKALGPTFEKLGTKIFGKEMGGEMGQIFTQLAGSYGEQFAQQILGPALFGGTEAGSKNANRFFNSLASGNKKAALEDFFYGISGGNIRIGARSAIGYEEGAKELAKELAGLTGAPFDPLFGMDPTKGKFAGVAGEEAQRLKANISDPIVEATYGAADRIIDQMNGISKEERDERTRERNRFESQQRTGGGTGVVTSTGEIVTLPSGGPDAEYYDAYGMPHDLPSTASTPFMGRVPKSVQVLTDLGSNYLGSRLGVDTGTFGGAMGQAGMNQMITNLLTGQQLTAGLSALNPSLMLGTGIAQAGVLMGSSGVTALGGGMQLGATGGYANMGAAGNLSAMGQAGYAAGVVGSALAAKSISDAFSGGYKSGVGDAAAMISSFFLGPIAGGFIGAGINRLFGRKAPEVTDSGITGTLKTDSASLKGYTDILEKGGKYRSDKRYTNYSELPPELVKGIGNALASLTDGIKNVGKIMGLDRTKRNEVFASTQRTVSLKDYSAEDQEFIKGLKEGTVARLPSGELVRVDAFVKGADQMRDVYRDYGDSGHWEQELVKGVTEAVTYTTVSAGDAYRAAYRKLLEGNFEQEIRVSLKGKSSEEIEEALQDMVENFADAFITDAFGNVLDRFKKEGERLFETFDRLAQATEAISDITMKLGYQFEFLNLNMDEFAAADLASTFFDLAGGVEKYASDVQFYFENFYTKEEQLEYVAEKGRQAMQNSLERVGLDAAMSVQGLTDMMGDNFDEAAIAYKKVVDDFIKANGGMEEIVKKGDPVIIEQLARLQGDLAKEYYATTKALQELERIKGTSKEELTGAARAIFMADMAAVGRSFAVGGVAMGPKSGYGAILHGTEAVVPLPNGREIPVELKFPTSELGLNRTYINNIVGNGNATVRSTPTNVITSPPQATSGSSPNRVLTSAY